MPFASQWTTILALSLLSSLPPSLKAFMNGRWESPDGPTSPRFDEVKTAVHSESLTSHRHACRRTLCRTQASCDSNMHTRVCIRQWRDCSCIYCSYADGAAWRRPIWLCVCVSGQQSMFMLWHFMHGDVFASELTKKKRKKVLNVFIVNTLAILCNFELFRLLKGLLMKRHILHTS